MSEQYPAIYTDAYGEEQTIIERRADGESFSMMLRGVHFQASAFDLFYVWPTDQNKLEELQRFHLQEVCISVGEEFAYQTLGEHILQWTMPLQIMQQDQLILGILHCTLKKLGPTEEHRYGSFQIHLVLQIGESAFELTNDDPTMALNLKRLQKQLPQGMYLKCCQFCSFSRDDLFESGLLCYRRTKEQIRVVKHLPVRRKAQHPINKLRKEAVYVHETYLCTEFEADPVSLLAVKFY